jgi:hypothetical protein
MAEPLTNPKWETFTQQVAAGIPPMKAYVAAGYSEAGASQGANRLLRSATVSRRLRELQEQISSAIVRMSIREKENRLSRQQIRWDKMHAVIEQRACDPTMDNIPGGSTGLLVRKLKQIGSGESAQVVEEYEVDTGLLGEIRKHEEHAANELGQWLERAGIAGNYVFAPVLSVTFDGAAEHVNKQAIEATCEAVKSE